MRNNRLQLLTVAFPFLILANPIWPLDPQSRIIPQESSPLTIVTYTSKYQEGSGRYAREGIRHDLEYENSTTRTVAAVQIGLVSFNVFNEFIDRTQGVSIKSIVPGGRQDGAWLASALADFSFLTGVAYVSKVRYENGEIWTADLDYVGRELAKIEEDFDVSILKGKENSK